MEDKIIKVICIDKENCGNICFEIEYDAIKTEKGYRIISDYTYPKEYFKEVKEDTLIVECIDNQEGLSKLIIGEKYKVIDEDNRQYKVVYNKNETIWINKSRFKPVEPQKEIKEYDFRKVVAEIKPNEEYRCQNFIVRCLEDNTIEMIAPSKNIIGFMNTDKFIKTEKPVTTAEAFKALDEGNIIESLITGNKYLKNDCGQLINIKITEKRQTTMFFEELEGKWTVIEEEKEC